MIIERALIAVILMIAGVLAYRLLVWWQVRRCEALATVDPLLLDCKDDVPVIVYFTTPMCAPCRLQQTPVLNQLQGELGENGLKLIRVDATENPDAARRWGVFSVPTTIVLDKNRQPTKVYNGVVGLETLKQELQVS